MRLTIFFLMLIMLSGGRIFGQTEEDAVKGAVNRFFTAMKNSDSKGLRAILADSALFQTIGADKNGKTVVYNEAIPSFIDFISKETPGNADERIQIEMVKIDGPLAMVWAPYKFYYKGKFSHCGMDSFQLVKIDGGWKVEFIIDTRRKEPCE